MGRTRKGSRQPAHPKPVEKVELSEKHVKLRLAAVILLAVIGATGIAFGVSSFFGVDSGWREIECKSQELNCADDFVFLYYLGDSGISASEENNAVTLQYSKAAEKAYQLFTNDAEFEDVHNVRYINEHPNEEIQVEDGLYQAFSLLKEYGNRNLYLAPVYDRYDDLFSCEDDSQAVDYDPYASEAVAEEYAEIAAYANDPASVEIELLEDNRIRLRVSQEYLDYAEENGIDSLIDFFWMENAFRADYLAEAMISSGYTKGSLSSVDGYVRNLDGRGTEYSFSVYDRVGDTVSPAAVLNYKGPSSMVYLRNYGMNSLDRQRYYQYRDGTIRTSYLDVKDGLCKSSRNDLLCYAKQGSCAEVLLQMIPLYVADSFPEDRIPELKEAGVYSVFCEDQVIYYNDPSAAFSQLSSGEGVVYRTQQME